ncbi:hypothetical protein [Anaerotignum sp. MB30-C6]|nr:hypothetical protein [Anaerotignum sp. MB30-C6]WMI81209.1 hypothetical protein RBQ60_00320 [Anaerotignum sp. MB30-C6]
MAQRTLEDGHFENGKTITSTDWYRVFCYFWRKLEEKWDEAE